MRRNVSTSLKHTQQHNSSLVPARVPIPYPFGQVASMRNQQVQKGTVQLQTQRANARHRLTFPHTNCHTIPFLDVKNNVQARFPSFRWSSPLASSRQSVAVSLRSLSYHRRGLAGYNRTLASKPVDVCVAAGPCIRSQRCVRWAASLLYRRLALQSAVRSSWRSTHTPMFAGTRTRPRIRL